MIPTTTGAARAVGEVLPALKDASTAWRCGCRRPTSRWSISPPSWRKPATEAEINQAMQAAAEGPLKGILAYCTEPLVSTDFNGSPFLRSSIRS